MCYRKTMTWPSLPHPARPPRPAQASTPDASIDAAVDARLALDKCETLDDDVKGLTLRVVQLEQAAASKAAKSGHTGAIIVTTIGTVGSLVVGILLWALNFAATTKTEAVARSTENVDQKIAAAQETQQAAYLRGVREGADEALAKLKKEQEEKDLVTVPRQMLKGKRADKQQ